MARDRPSRSASFARPFLEDLAYWVREDRRVALRILDLMDAVLRDPLAGMGKPEPLRNEWSGYWSRRITQEHRLVYRVTGDSIDFVQARYHY